MLRPLIAVVDYDAGNLHSVTKACAAVGMDARLTSRPADLEAADAVILPGVGAFPDCMRRLDAGGMVPALQAFVRQDRPFLGICLGLQLLFEYGEEGGGAAGLGVFAGRVRRVAAPGLKVPHMGWNALRLHAPSPLFEGIPEGAHVYFVHSYHAEPSDDGVLSASVDYGGRITAAVRRGRVHAVQFHPEKSSAIGLRLLSNFARLSRGGGPE